MFKPALPCIKMDEQGDFFVEGRRCLACGAVMTEIRLACPACGARAGFSPFRAATTGKLHAFSIVKRSYPGIEVPFISAIVDLADGLCLKGNLLDVPPAPEAVTPGQPVRLVFGDALGRKDKEGASYIAFFFEPT